MTITVGHMAFVLFAYFFGVAVDALGRRFEHSKAEKLRKETLPLRMSPMIDEVNSFLKELDGVVDTLQMLSLSDVDQMKFCGCFMCQLQLMNTEAPERKNIPKHWN